MEQPAPTDRESRPVQVPFLRLVTHVIRPWSSALAAATLGAAVTALVLFGAAAVWYGYAGWRLGWIELTNDGSPLRAQVFPESGDEPVGEPFDVVEHKVLSLPAGDYRLRVHGVGRLGRTYRFAVNRGERQAHALSLDEGRLLGGEPLPQIWPRGKTQREADPVCARRPWQSS